VGSLAPERIEIKDPVKDQSWTHMECGKQCHHCGSIREYEQCPKCKTFSNSQHGFVCAAGMRSGKTVLSGMIAAYYLHKLLRVGNLLAYFNLSQGTKLYIVFAGDALTADNEWDAFYNIWKQSTLLTSYPHTESPGCIEYDHIICCKITRPIYLRGHVIAFSSVGDYGWLDPAVAKDFASIIKSSLSSQRSTNPILKPISIYSGSPQSATDPLMMMLTNGMPMIDYYHYATWEMNPDCSRAILANKEQANPKHWERDYAAFKCTARSLAVINHLKDGKI